MKLLQFVALIAVAKASVEYEQANFSGRIINGQDAVIGDEFVIRILSVEDTEAILANVSSGVAISHNFGLVVAQAIRGFEYWYVGYGSIHVGQQLVQSISGKNVIEHPDYDPETLRNNIGVIKFTIPVDQYRPIATSRPTFPVLNSFGYGFTGPDNTILSNTLQQMVIMYLSVTDPNVCGDLYSEFDVNNSICGLFATNSGYLDGDQGGAITDSSRSVVHGIISYWGNGADEPLVSINIPSYLDFINDSIEKLSPAEEDK